MTAEVVPATVGDLYDLWMNLRADQMEDVSGASERELFDQVDKSVEVWCGKYQGRPVIVWGVLMPSILSSTGVLWALTSKEIEKCPLVFVRQSKIELERLRGRYHELTGYVATEYEVSARWLKWLGFDISPNYTFHGKNVRRISMKGKG